MARKVHKSLSNREKTPARAAFVFNRANRGLEGPRRGGRITERNLVRRVRGLAGARKRWFDVFVTLPLFLITSPLFATLMVVCGMATRSWPIAGETVIGHQGRCFQRLRFKMPPAGARGLTGLVRKTFMSSSLGRLPELLNVLSGDMSVVGPGAVSAEGVEAYGALRRYYLVARPGLVAQWEVCMPAAIGAERRREVDRDYVETWTLLKDLRILALRAGKRRARF